MAKKYLILIAVVLLLALGTVSSTLADVKEPGDPAVSDAGAAPTLSFPEALWPGPDGFGYAGSTPAYSWVEISGTGTSVLLGDDASAGPFPIGFTFNFYGTPWTDFFVSSNGFMSFGAGSTSLTNQCPLPSATLPNNIIPLYWDDLDPGDTSDPVFYQSFADGTCPYPGYAGACLVVQYEDFCHYPGGAACDIAGTWEGILFDDHSLVIQFEDSGVENGSGSTTGIENDNAPADYGLTFACDTAGSVVDGTTARFAVEPFLALLPETETTIGCADQDQIHTYTLMNFTGVDGTFDLTYSVPSMNGFLTGPADIFVPDGTSADFEATLTPNCVPPDTLIEAQVDVAGNGFNDSSTIMKTIVDAGLGYWEGLNPINGLGRSRPAAAGVNGKVYVVGGEISGGRADTVEEFDPATGIWTTKTGLMPTPASNVCAAAIGSDIYIPGGYDAAGAYLNNLQVYHVDTDTWETIATDPLPEPKAGPGCAALDGKLYAYAGVTTGGAYTNTAYVYDPAAPAGTRWTALPNMTYTRGYLAGTAVNGKVYAVGGRDGTTADFAYVEAYDPADAMWHTLTNMNLARGAPGAFAWGDDLVVCGGGWTNYRNTCENYDTTAGYGGAWTNLAQTMVNGRRTFGYATLPEALYAVAGYNGTFLTAAERIPGFECPSCGLQFPDIVVDPLSFDVVLPLDATTTLPLTISNVGDAPLQWAIASWFDNFDSYAAGSQMHGQGGWKGWFNDPGAGALVSDAYSYSAPNSVEIVGASDLVHEYAGYTTGTWTYTAWQYIPSGFSGQSYFILLNTYNDQGIDLNWSTQVTFNSASGLVENLGITGGTLPMITDQWVELRVVIDLDSDTQAFFYDDQLLYEGTWTDENSGDGALNIGAVDLFANGASPVYYDDVSLAGEIPPWLSVAPDSGMIDPGLSTIVDVTFDSTGLAVGAYSTELDISSNDPGEPVVSLPVTLTVTDLAGPPDIEVYPLALQTTLPIDATGGGSLVISNTGESDLEWLIYEAGWYDNFDSYAPGSQMHGQGGWKGWFNNPAAGALVSDAYSHSDPNSVAVVGATDLVHEYAGYTADTWTYTAWQYIPGTYSGQTYFIMLNTYNDDNIGLNWSTQVCFNSATDRLYDDVAADCSSGASLSIVYDQWVEIRVEIDLDNDIQTLYYNGEMLYQDSWTDHVSGDGALNIGAVDLFANNASEIYYDDISLVGECGNPAEIPWLSATPYNGTIDPGLFTLVDVGFDSTGMATGEYTADLCIASNDPDEPVVTVPVTMTVVAPAIELDKTVGTEEGVCAVTDAIEVVAGTEVFYCYTVENVGDTILYYHTLNDSALGVLFADMPYELGVGASYSYIHSAVPITESVVNTGTWYAYLELGGYYVSAVDTASVSVLPGPEEADLSVTKEGPAMVYVGEDITYLLTVANAGPADATGVFLTDILPVGVTFVSASTGCVEAEGIVTCDVGDLAAGASVEITIVVTAPAEPDTLTNDVEVSGDQPDPFLDNNTDSFDTEVAEVPVEYYQYYLPLIFKP